MSSEVITAPKTVSVLSNISKKKQNSLREFGGEQQPVGFSEDSRAGSCIRLEAYRSGNELMSYSCLQQHQRYLGEEMGAWKGLLPLLPAQPGPGSDHG